MLCRYGRLGTGHEPGVMDPTPVAGLASQQVVAAACGSAHTLALTAEGSVYAFGYGGHGALGLGGTDNRLVPELVPGLPPCK
jgi:alpha-tubulin suppressor-like RCC1 family protein